MDDIIILRNNQTEIIQPWKVGFYSTYLYQMESRRIWYERWECDIRYHTREGAVQNMWWIWYMYSYIDPSQNQLVHIVVVLWKTRICKGSEKQTK